MLQSLFLAFTFGVALAGSSNPADDIIELALRDLEGGSVAELKDRILSNSIPAFSAEFRRHALAFLPEEVRRDRITASALCRRVERVGALVLEADSCAGRFEFLLFHRGQPLAMLWRGCVVVVSDSLASGLDDEQLAGIIAHEIGHAYFMKEIIAARTSGDERAMRVVELKCDAAAILTLKLMGRDPSKYFSGLRRLTTRSVYDGYEPQSWSHPLIGDRERFSRRFIKLMGE